MQMPFCAIMRSWTLLAAFGGSYAPDIIYLRKCITHSYTHRTTALSNIVCASSGKSDDSYMCMSPELPLVSGIIRDNEYYNYNYISVSACAHSTLYVTYKT